MSNRVVQRNSGSGARNSVTGGQLSVPPKTSPIKGRGTAHKGGGGVRLQLAVASDGAGQPAAQSEPAPSAPACALRQLPFAGKLWSGTQAGPVAHLVCAATESMERKSAARHSTPHPRPLVTGHW